MSDRKRTEYSEVSKGGRKRPRLEVGQHDSPFSEQEISVHPYEDDFNFELDSPDQEEMVAEHSPNVTLEPGLDILIDSPAFPLSKASRETSKHGRRRYRGGADDSPEHMPQLTKSTTLPVVDSRRNRERDNYSRSRSKSPYSSEPIMKSRIVKRNTSGGRHSPLSGELGQEARYSDQYSGRSGEDRERRSKHSRGEHRSKQQSDSREYDSRKVNRDSRMPSREQSMDSRSRGRDHYGSTSIDLGILGYKREKRYLGDDRGVSGLKRRSPSRREPAVHYRRREREDRREKPYREATKEKKRHHRHHGHREVERGRLRKLPEVVLRGSGDETEGVELLPDKIEDLIKDIQESSTDSSSEEETEVKESVEGEMKSPESVSSRSFSSPPEEEREKSVSPRDPREEGQEAMEGTGDREGQSESQSESEGEVHSPGPAQPYVMRSRFDTSDHSDYSDEDTNQTQSQQGYPHYPEQLSEEGSGASAVNSPEPPQEMTTDPPCPLPESPEPPPVPALPPYLPALMGCKNVESYEWLDRIEEGTYGVVYKAKDKRTGEIVALKKLKMEKEKEGFPITSLREINMLLKAAHPNIVPVREIVVGSNMDKIYIVMDFIKHDLKALMSTMKEKFLEGEVKTLMIHLLRAVHHMHDNWILHRDLKTSNLLLSHDNILKVADFGLAREYGSPLLNYTPVVVTLWYRSPELLLGAKEYSTAVDVWSVGCIFAELLLHKALFTGRSEIDQLNKIFTELGTPNERIWPGFKQLPGAKNVTFTQHPQGNLRKKYPQLTTQSGFDLLFKLLAYDPKKRITAKDALDHQYFRDMPKPVPPEMFPTWPTKSEIAKNKQKRERSPTPPEGGAFVLKGADQLGSPGPGFSLKF